MEKNAKENTDLGNSLAEKFIAIQAFRSCLFVSAVDSLADIAKGEAARSRWIGCAQSSATRTHSCTPLTPIAPPPNWAHTAHRVGQIGHEEVVGQFADSSDGQSGAFAAYGAREIAIIGVLLVCAFASYMRFDAVLAKRMQTIEAFRILVGVCKENWATELWQYLCEYSVYPQIILLLGYSADEK